MRSEWNGETYTQYYREPIMEMTPARREGRRSARAAASGTEERGGRSGPPPPRREEAPSERTGRVYGAMDMPKGPVYVRKPPERPVRASMQRKVSLSRRGPRIGLMLISVLVVLLAAGGSSWYFLTQSQDGQMLMAVWGWSNAPIEAYWRLGESKMREWNVSEAIDAFKKAYDAEAERGGVNIDGILALANAYESDGQTEEAVKLYTDLIETVATNHPEAYLRMHRMYKDAGKHKEAVEMLEKGRDACADDRFVKLIREYSPDAPYATVIGGRFDKEVRVFLKATEGTVIKYTLDDRPPPKSDEVATEDDREPFKHGKVYEGEELFFGEGTVRVRAVAVQENGVPSKEMDETYTVVFPTPDSPKANVPSGTYDYAPTVTIKAADKRMEIHYTVDNTPATVNSPLYTGPIKLRLGTTYLRAIAIDHRGKVSYEMNVEYKVKGAVKKMFNSNDGFDKLVLMKTTYDQFVRTYGKPDKYEQIDIGGPNDLFRADYSFGYACFIQVEAAGKALLYELMVESGSIQGPRKIKIGTSESAVIAAFRDMGGQAMENGERLLYDNGTNSLGAYRLGEDGNFAAHYYYPRDKKNEYVEVAFYFQRDEVVRMHWLRYTGDT